MVVYGGTSEFNPPTPAQKEAERQKAQARTTQAQAETQAVQQQRQQAPGAISKGSQEETAVRAEAVKAEQQRMTQEGFQRTGKSQDQFQAQRDQAIKSGSFNYGNVSYAQKGTPPSYVNKQGTRITVPQGGITGKGSSSDVIPTPNVETKPPPIQISKATLQRSDALRQSEKDKPLETIANINIVKGTSSTI